MIGSCKLIELPKITDGRGCLTFVEGGDKHLPFNIARVYYLYDIPQGQERGAHGHRQLQQLVIAVSGSFDITLNDGSANETFHLNSPEQGLYVAPMMWRELNNFSTDAVCLVLASMKYDETDYFRDYNEFMAAIKNV